MRTHRILTDRLAEFGASSKLNAELTFLQMLEAEGRTTAEDFQSPMGGMWGALDRGYRRSSGGMLTMSPIDLIGSLGILVGLSGATCFEGAARAGIDPSLLYRVAAIGCGAHRSLPHHGIPGAMIALVVVIVPGSPVGSF